MEYKEKDTRKRWKYWATDRRLHGKSYAELSRFPTRSSATAANCNLEIKADGSVVRAPLRLSEAKFRKFVEEKQEWSL